MAHIKKALTFPQINMQCQGEMFHLSMGRMATLPISCISALCMNKSGQSELGFHAVLSAFTRQAFASSWFM